MKVTCTESLELDRTHIYTSFESKLVVDNNNLYFVSPKDDNLRIARLSTDGDTLSPGQSIPTSDDEALSRKLRTGIEAAKETHLSEGPEKVHHATIPIVPPPIRGKDTKARMVAVCNDVFYAEQGP